jgi:cell division protein FtsN
VAHRDYKSSEPRRAEKRKPRRGGAIKAFLSVIVLGLLLAGVILWKMWPRPSDFRQAPTAPSLSAPAATENAPPPTANQPPPEQGSVPVQTPNFTFYDILPGNKAPRPLPARPAAEQWWLQVAALKNANDADALRAKLMLLNFGTVVEPTKKDDTTLYRVRVGPYPNQAAAETAQKQLAENKFEARPLKQAVTP